MNRTNRRDLLMGAGALGVAALATSMVDAQESGQLKRPDVRGLSDALKLDPSVNKHLEPLYGPGGPPVVIERLRSGAKAEPESIPLGVSELSDSSGKTFAYALSATIPSRGVYPLTLNGQPFVVTRFSCGFDRIAWVAGTGWPLYTTRCPRHDFGPRMFFRDAFAHQIVPWLPGVGYGIGCENPTAYDFGRSAQLHVGVNDDLYNDNLGTFVFTIYSYS